MRSELLGLAARLAATGEPFVVAVVVRREPASSAQVGNMAVISQRGEFHGWLGGSCIRPTVVREAQAALNDGKPRLISLSPEPSADHRPGVTVLPMTCHSGGSVDIYVEPVLPVPHLLVLGITPVAQALVRLGKGMGYAVDAADPEADASIFPDADHVLTGTAPDSTWNPASAGFSSAFRAAVVATHGERDEDAIAEAIALDPGYLGVVASRKRFAQMRETLLARGIPQAALDRIRNPAGLDILAKTPEEVALSVLAEIVQVRHSPPPVAAGVPARAEVPADALDPVCGMTVRIATAKHRAEHGGRTFYFCCGGCRQRFLAAPEQYEAAVPR